MPKNPIIIAVTGLPSSGKGTFSEIAKKFGFKILVMGDVIREECRKRGLEINRQNSDIVMMNLRKERGLNAVAVITLEWINEAIEKGIQKILIDGVRSRAEIDFFNKHISKFTLIGIHASPAIRLKRALSRRRIDDAYNSDAFFERDKLELDLGVGDVLATSDILIISEGSFEETNEMYEEVLENIIAKTEDPVIAEN